MLFFVKNFGNIYFCQGETSGRIISQIKIKLNENYATNIKQQYQIFNVFKLN
jgi:hypothetical protein